jgi:hypothetical protein
MKDGALSHVASCSNVSEVFHHWSPKVASEQRGSALLLTTSPSVYQHFWTFELEHTV